MGRSRPTVLPHSGRTDSTPKSRHGHLSQAGGRKMTTQDAATGRSALRKATWRLLPLIALGYGISYMDRVNISFAALRMNADLHFSATIYGLGGGLFFLSYALLEIPSNLMLVKFG